MKRMMILLLALALALSPALAEEAAPGPAGEWHAQTDGLALTLTLHENGAYTLSIPALRDSSAEGAWELRDGYVYLDGDENVPLNYTGDRLIQAAQGLFFSREPAAVYVPAGAVSDARPEDFAGAWRSAYVLLDGAALPAGLLDEDVRLYVEDTRAALTGGIFADSVLDFTYENGALSFAAGDFSILLQMQQDEALRMTLSAAGEEMTLILFSWMDEGLFPEENAAQ